MLRRTLAEWWTAWVEAGETKVVAWKWIRRALALGFLSLSVSAAGVILWVRDAQRDAELASYEASLASWENAADTFERCVGAVETRDQFRRLLIQTEATFVGFIAAVEAANPESVVLDGLRASVARYDALIEEDWAPLDIADCGPAPVAPTPPN